MGIDTVVFQESKHMMVWMIYILELLTYLFILFCVFNVQSSTA